MVIDRLLGCSRRADKQQSISCGDCSFWPCQWSTMASTRWRSYLHVSGKQWHTYLPTDLVSLSPSIVSVLVRAGSLAGSISERCYRY